MTRGFILVEAAVSYVILAVAITVLVPMFIVALRASKHTEKLQVAADLSNELLEEVRLRRWDENTPLATVYISTPSTTLGLDAGETATDIVAYTVMDSHGATTTASVAVTVTGVNDGPVFLDGNATDRKSTRLNSSHIPLSRMPSSA